MGLRAAADLGAHMALVKMIAQSVPRNFELVGCYGLRTSDRSSSGSNAWHGRRSKGSGASRLRGARDADRLHNMCHKHFFEQHTLGVQVMRVFFFVSIVEIIGAPQSGPPRPLAAAEQHT